MKKIILSVIITLTCIKLSFSQTTSHQQQEQNTVFTSNPYDAKFISDDILRFWQVYDETYPRLPAKAFQEKYIDKGTEGLKNFIFMRIVSAKKLRKTIKANIAYYKAIRESSLSITKKQEQFYKNFTNLTKIYPAAVFPDVYFVIGRKNTGGTAFKGGLILGAEMFGRINDTPPARIDIEMLDEVVAHELIHFQQHYAPDNSLLAQCIREGSADFLGELISGDHNNHAAHAYGEKNKESLWKEFLTRKDGADWSNWLYRTKDEARRDVGYWIGYKITKAYYDKADDKMKAVEEILTIKDFTDFLTRSGYADN